MKSWVSFTSQICVGFKPATGVNLKIKAFFLRSSEEELSIQSSFRDFCSQFDHQMLDPKIEQWSESFKAQLKELCPSLARLKFERGDGFSWEV